MVQCLGHSHLLWKCMVTLFLSVCGKASLSLQNLYVRTASDVCGWIILHWSFTPVATTIFSHILGNGQCHWTPVPCGGCWCQCGLPFSFIYIAALGCHVASFEPNRNPRCYLETSAGSPRPASPQMDNLFCGHICLEGSRYLRYKSL